MTQLGGQDELIESPKEWQISEAGGRRVRRGGGNKRGRGEAGQCSMIERSANVDEAAAAASTAAASCSCTLGAALMSCSRMNQSSTAAQLPPPPLQYPLPCHIRQLGGCGGVVWRGRGVEL